MQYVATRQQALARARRAVWLLVPVAAMCVALGLWAPSAQAANTCTGTALSGSPFTAAGAATVPANAVALCVYARGGSGAAGGGSAGWGAGGVGAEQISYYLVGGSSRFLPDLGLSVLVGGIGTRPTGGAGGGGRAGGTSQGAGSPSLAGGGGGRSSVSPQTGDTSEIVVAGGGGGGGSGASGQPGGAGGKWGQAGGAGNANSGSGGGAGTQSSGGAAGTGISAGNGSAGNSGTGGNGAVQNTGRGGGGGGGGYYGGGGGGGGGNGGAFPTSRGGGGGGGSNFHDTSGLMSLTGNPSVADGPANTAGQVAISYYTALSGLDLTASPSPVSPGQPVAYTAFLDPGASGSIEFKEGGTTLCTSSILLGVASCDATAGSLGSHTITASYAGDATHAPSEDTVDMVVADIGPAVSFTMSAPASATAGDQVNVTVTARDEDGDTATGYTGTVHFTSSDPGVALPSDYAFTGADAGTHTFTGVSLTTAGSQTITATDAVTSSLTGTSGSISVGAAAVDRLIVSAPSSATAGSGFGATVTARDAFGNVATGYRGAVAFSSSDPDADLPGDYEFDGADAGTHTFTGVTLKTAGSQTVSATDTMTSSVTGTSDAIDVDPAAASSLVVSASSSVTAGSGFGATVTARDAFGNVATGYGGTVAFSSSDAAAEMPGDYEFTGADAGTHAFTGVTLKTAGARTVSATDTMTSSVTGTSGSISVGAAAASSLVVTASASATAGSAFGTTVTAKDAFGNVATGYRGTIAFSSSDPGAELPGEYEFTGADDGSRMFSGVMLKTAGVRTVTATDSVTSSISGTSAAIDVGPAATSTFAVGLPSGATAGSAVDVVLTASDSFGNRTPDYTGTVSFASTDAEAALPGETGFEAADNGRLTLAGGVTFKTAGDHPVSATDTVSSSVTGTSDPVHVDPAEASSLEVSAPSSATAGSAFGATVTARDAYGNVATGYRGTVGFSSTDPGAELPGDYEFTGADAGTHTFTGAVTLKTAGARTVTATDAVTSSVIGTSGAITVGAAAVDHLTVSTPSSATAGSAFGVTVTAKDAYGNVATGYRGTLAFDSTDAGAELPGDYEFVGADGGTHAFSGVTLKSAGSRTVTATDTMTSSVAGTSDVIDVDPAGASSLEVSAPSAATAGSGFGTTVTARDAFGNVATGYRGTVAFSSSDAGAELPGDYEFDGADAGTHTFAGVRLKTAGGQTVTATDTATSSVTGTSGSISVGAAAASSLVVTASASATAGSAFGTTVTAKDAYGNVATGYVGTVAFDSSDPDADLPGDYEFVGADAGTHTFTGVGLTTAGSKTVTATDTVTSSLTGTSAAIDVSPAATSTFAVGLPSGATAGSAVDVVLTASDSFGNRTPDYTGTVSFASSDAEAALPGETEFEAADNGRLTLAGGVTFKTAGDHTVSATDTVSSSVTGTSDPVHVGPATRRRLVVTTSASGSTAGDALDVTVTAVDELGNTDSTYDGTVRFTSTDDQADLPAEYTFVPGNDHGTHTFTDAVTYKTAGGRTTSATDTAASSMTGTSAVTAVSSAATSRLKVEAPSTVVSGTPFDVTVTAKDEFGNTTPSYTGTIAFTSTLTDASLAPDYTFTSADDGVHEFPGAFTLLAAGERTITATDTASASIAGTSDTIDVRRGAVSLSAAGLTFGTVTTGSSSEPQTLTVTNSGTAPLDISALTIGGADAGEFATSADTCSGTALGVDASCSVRVTFSPSAAGDASATLLVASDAADSPSVVTLSGTGEAAPPTPTPPDPSPTETPAPTETTPEPTPPAQPQPVAEQRAVSEVVRGRIQVKVDGKFTALAPGQPVPFPATFRPILVKGLQVPLVIVGVADAKGRRQHLAMRSPNVFVLNQTANATTVRMKRIKTASCRGDDKKLGWIRVEASTGFQVAGRNSTAVAKRAKPVRWTTTERCAGTVTRVKRGAVVVHDARTNRKVTVRAGERYLAATALSAAG